MPHDLRIVVKYCMPKFIYPWANAIQVARWDFTKNCSNTKVWKLCSNLHNLTIIFLSNLLQNQSGNSDVLLKCFLESFFNFIGLVTIWTVHLDVRLTVQVQSFLRIRRSVWTTTTTTVVVRTLLCCGNSLQSRQGIKFTGTAWSEISVLRSLNMLDVIGICQNWANALWTTEARSRLTKLCDVTQLLIFSKSFFVKSFLGLVFAGSNRNESN